MPSALATGRRMFHVAQEARDYLHGLAGLLCRLPVGSGWLLSARCSMSLKQFQCSLIAPAHQLSNQASIRDWY